jgi:sulfate permease, SulP family
MYALVIGMPIGTAALPMAIMATLIGFIVGGMVQPASWRGMQLAASPNSAAVLMLSAMLFESQALPGARGNLAVAIIAIAASGAPCGALLLFARLRIGGAMKLLPFPVVAGFSNAVALSLIVSMKPIALGHAFLGRLPQIGSWWHEMRPGAIAVAAAGTAAGILTRQRWPKAPATLAALLLAALVHHALVAWSDVAFGPILNVGADLLPGLPDWAALAAAAHSGPLLWTLMFKSALVLAVLNALFSLLTAAALMRSDDPPLDGNALLHSLGLGTLASAATLGLPIAIVPAASSVVRSQPVPRHPVLAVYVVALLAVFICGHDALRQLPLPAVAAAVFTTSTGLFYAWSLPTLRMLLSRGRPERRALANLAVSLGVAAVGVLFGLAETLFLGMLPAVALLAIELRRNVVIGVADGRQRRSRRVRAAVQAARLAEMGAQIRIVELGHWLYFGNMDELGMALNACAAGARWLILDMRRLAGVDATAARALWMTSQRLSSAGVQLLIGGIGPGTSHRVALSMFGAADAALPLFADVDEALERVEEALLGLDRATETSLDDAIFPLAGLRPERQLALRSRMTPVPVAAGERLFAAGDVGNAMYLVIRGRPTL